jgi:hypothetical protein
VHCFTDHHGFPRIEVAPLPATVESFLEQDIQGSTEYADELIAVVDRIAAGSLQNWEATGNAFAIVLSRDGVSIDCVWGEDNCTLSLADFRESLVAWRNFISSPAAR